MDKSVLDKYIKAGKIVQEVKQHAKTLIKEGGSLALDIAEKIDAKIIELGGRPSFPTDVSINEIAAHYCPTFNDKTVLKKGDLVKLDIGVHVDGYLVDTAVTVSVGKNEENEKLIRAAEKALEAGIKASKPGVEVSKIGKAIQEEILKHGFQVIRNLSGHSIGRWKVHAGLTIPNIDNGDKKKLKDGDIVAVEPFSTTGEGVVIEGKNSEVYEAVKEGNIRAHREVLEYIANEFHTLPFCKRYLIKKFGALKAGLAIRQMLGSGLIKEFKILREKKQDSKVAQAEHTIIIGKTNKILT